MRQIVVLDDEPAFRDELTRALAAAEFAVVHASNGVELLRKVFSLRPQAVVLDLQVARVDGLELIRVLRAATNLPIVATSRTPSSQAAVRALDMGADDFIQKPVDIVEMVARLRAAVRRYERQGDGADERIVRTGDLVIDRDTQLVTKAGQPISLTRTEYRLLDALAARPAQIAPHRYLLSTVWGEEYVDDTHYLRVYIGYLRAKLESDPAHPRFLINEWGTGYRLAKLPPEDAEITLAVQSAVETAEAALATVAI